MPPDQMRLIYWVDCSHNPNCSVQTNRARPILAMAIQEKQNNMKASGNSDQKFHKPRAHQALTYEVPYAVTDIGQCAIGFAVCVAAALLFASYPALSQPQNSPATKRFDIPDGSAYLCTNKDAANMVMALMYSRTSPELASVIQNAATQKIEMVPTWLFIPPGNDRQADRFNYRNTNIASSVLTILPEQSRVLISGDAASMEFVDCMMINRGK